MDKTVQMTADGSTVTYLTIYQLDPNVDYVAFNMTLTVPKGTKINQVKQGRDKVNDIFLSARATTTHSISCNMADERTLKIACVSSLNQPLYPDDGEGTDPYAPLFTIGLLADPSTINGTYAVEMTGCRFVKEDGNSYSATDLDHVEYSDFTVAGGTDVAGVDYTIPAEGCGTMILPYHCAVPEGMKVYACDGIADNTLTVSEVSGIEANTPYLVFGTPGDYHFTGIYRALKAAYSTEYMTGVFETMTVPQGAYVMQNHKATHGVGFYRVGSVETTVNPYRCYLNALPESNANMMRMPFDGTTGLENLFLSAGPVNVYNEKGQLIRANVSADKALRGLSKGIYIINDKKIIIE